MGGESPPPSHVSGPSRWARGLGLPLPFNTGLAKIFSLSFLKNPALKSNGGQVHRGFSHPLSELFVAALFQRFELTV